MEKNAIVIVGSARRNGNTDILCSAAADAMRENMNVTTVYPSEMDIRHCTNCGGCDDSGVCVIDDDMRTIYNGIENSDVLLIGTPVHFSGVSSIMKQVIDRLQCMWVRSNDRSGKVMAVISNGGSPKPNFRNIISVCRSVSNSIGSDWAGELTVNDTDNGLNDADLKNAASFGKHLIDQMKISSNSD